MFERVLRRVTVETELLVLVAVLSLSASSFLVADASIALRDVLRYGSVLLAIRVAELAVGVAWLSLSIRLLVDVNRFRKEHRQLFFLRLTGKSEEDRKREATDLIVGDMIAFYRGYYAKIGAILVLAVLVDAIVIAAAVHSLFYGYMSIWEAVFRWAINSSMALVASVLYIYVHRNWGRKLLRLKNGERRFSEMLGGPVEA